MDSIEELVKRLELQRREHASAASRIERAIQLLRQDGTGTTHRIPHNGAGTATTSVGRRTMSPEARRKISLAMKRRHAAARNARTASKPIQIRARKKPHWTQTPQGRKKFAAIRAKAHQKAA